MKKYCLLLAGFMILQMTTVFAQKDSLKNLVPVTYTSKHSVRIDNKQISYTATVGTIILKNSKDEPIARFGYTAYVKDGETDMSKRPLTFAYNGGPGSSSMWLHLGVIGPRRIVIDDPYYNGPAPYKVEDNNNSILDVSDIVLIDPVGTGLSRAVGKGKNEDFWQVDGDISSVSSFIKAYILQNDRFNSPKYLLGESYGTFRSAGVANYLQDQLGISVNGIVLVSSVLDIRTLAFLPGDDLSYIVNLPTYAATAWYHHKVPGNPANLQSFVDQARAFAAGPYAAALMKGEKLPAAEKENVLNQLEALTGISKAYWNKADLRLTQPQFSQELLRDSNQIVGRLDARYKAIADNPLAENAYRDPQSDAISPAYISAFLNYYYTDLKVSKEETYNTSAYELPGFHWDWKHNASNGLFGDAATPNTAPDLKMALTHNPHMKVMVLNGMYDLATPFYATEFTMDHLFLDKSIQNNIILKYYEAGHMMYVHNSSAAAFKKDVAGFITANVKQ
ncbi:MAG TPA: hypothetical protein VFS36_08400 [Chitinophagaceae bacterium]|nr:hypothetical protein [Chitinophagaceae bacterium]